MQGYYRYPTIHKQRIIFVSEDDLWTVPRHGGIARRLTSSLAIISHPFISPDGRWVAFIGREEGHPEVYCMPAQGGNARRLTFLGSLCAVVGWSKDSRRILFASNTGEWYLRTMHIYSVSREKDHPQMIPVGPATQISYGPRQGVVIGRHTADPARWKRYRGGTAGVLWIDVSGRGNFRELINLHGNFASPMWIDNRIYFICDQEGIGNIYSCTPAGRNLKRHTDHLDFYARNATTDGRQIVYHAGGELYCYDTARNKTQRISVDYHSPRVQTNRKFVAASKYLEDYSLHPKGERVAVTSRGKTYSMANWDGPITQHGIQPDARYRLARWLRNGKQIVLVHDERKEDALQLHDTSTSKKPTTLPLLDIGRPVELEASPTQDIIALTNHRHELILVDLKRKKRTIVDRSKYARICDIAWSADGEWLAYCFPESEQLACIKLCEINKKKTYQVTRTVLRDFSPSFDPEGRFLYFLSNRHFDPVYDTMQFELSFPANTRPYLITLRKDIPAPFKPTITAPGGLDLSALEKLAKKKSARTKKLRIDLEGIQDRVVAIPQPPGIYHQIWGTHNRILFTSFPVEGGIRHWLSDIEPSNGKLDFFDLKEQKTGTIARGVKDFKLSQNGEVLIYRAKDRLRIVKPTEKIDEKLPKHPPGAKSGWLDLARIKVMIVPQDEWQQMFDDVWRLQRDHFWTKDMSGVDWKQVHKRYLPLLQRIGSRSEFSDLIWEMQGELGTSHAYEWGGDYRQEPQYRQGFLGADLAFDRKLNGYRITNIVRGDPWEPQKTSPLLAPGVNIRINDMIIAVNGTRVTKHIMPQEVLVNQAGMEISLTVVNRRGKNKRTVSVRTLTDESLARYRDWIERNRDYVHKKSKNEIGYVHIPDMGPFGFAEFHRYFLGELKYPGLIVDVRFNRGGHVSQLLIEKLRRMRIGYDITRWGTPEPYPLESILGPIVCLTNENAGSDGDIFSHAFKLYKIGPLIGKRTWGGVVGISPYYTLSDGGLTTQPEYSFWFFDVGWGVENHGTDPDIEVDIKPQDYLKGKDPQMDRGIQECLKIMRKKPPEVPSFGNKPRLKLPGKLKK